MKNSGWDFSILFQVLKVIKIICRQRKTCGFDKLTILSEIEGKSSNPKGSLLRAGGRGPAQMLRIMRGKGLGLPAPGNFYPAL